MSDKTIPEHIDPFRYAEQNLSVEGIVALNQLPRLAANLYAADEVAHANIEFGVDEQGTKFLKGHIQAKLTLQCQRCMEPLEYEIMSDFALGVVATLDEANALPGYYEPAMTQEGELALRELIEEELILNLPIIPRHEPEQCKVSLTTQDAGWEEEKSKNPFHVLETLKQKQ